MKKFQLILITENQNSKEKAEKLAKLISEFLACKNVVEITKYDKFENAYRIAIEGVIEDADNAIEAAIKLTDQICSPWLVTYNRTENAVELFFNKTKHAKFWKDEFNVLIWGNFEMIQA